MKKMILLSAVFLLNFFVLSAQSASDKTIYGFKMIDIQGKEKSLSDYKGKVVLIVNVASKCGLTKQYAALEDLYKKYKDKGLVILGFPCNQFMGQEPGTEAEIAEFCSVNYGVSFPLFSKLEVNGDNAHPLYKQLKSQLPGTSAKPDIEWNFAKFLVNKKGVPVQRFVPRFKPEDLGEAIEKLLAE